MCQVDKALIYGMAGKKAAMVSVASLSIKRCYPEYICSYRVKAMNSASCVVVPCPGKSCFGSGRGIHCSTNCFLMFADKS